MKNIVMLALAAIVLGGCTPKEKKVVVTFNDDPANRKVEVLMDGQPFTNFIYPADMEKPVLNPIYTASGKVITRGYPLEPRAFEPVDHPHHVGMWFNFGDVNGLDFWNNSFAIPAERKHRYGSVKFDRVVSLDPAKGELVFEANWVNQGDTVLLKEHTAYIFAGEGDLRTIEHITTLTAQADTVVFTENKEGLIAIRMDRAFQEPTDKPAKYTDANGIETEVPVVNNEGITGRYRNADGGQNEAGVWSKRSAWVAVTGEKEGETITVAILDNPANPGYPAWSHARGYGLFATNNLGGRAFDKSADPVQIVLAPGESLSFKHKVVIGGALTDEQINAMATAF
jgi:hypothetical protein